MTEPAVAVTGAWPPHTVLAEPLLKFGNDDQSQVDSHPLRGLLRFGPYAQPPADTVRVATITLTGQRSTLYEFLQKATRAHEPDDRRAYVPRYPGFAEVFGCQLVPERSAHVDLSLDVAGAGPEAHERLAEALVRAVVHLHGIRDAWDVIVLLLPRAWEPLRLSADGSLDLHDRLKAVAAPLGCPIQVVREASALQFRYECSMYWRLSLALLAKAGGVPFRMVQPTPTDTAYVGLAYAIRGGTTNEFVTCCSQVFDAEGGGFEFIAYNVGADRDLENPHLTRDEMRAVMARSARLYQRRQAGGTPRRLVVHKTTEWRPEEVEGVFDAWGAAVPDIECLRVRAESPWRAVALRSADGGKSAPDTWPAARGSLQYLSGRDALLWVAGTADGVALQGGRYNTVAKALPTPIAFTRDAGEGPLETPASEILALTKLDWNNDALHGLTPVTLSYSQKLAKMISRAPTLPDGSYQFRLFM